MPNHDGKLTRIGVFYDGNYFFHVSNYYKFNHQKKRRISIPGLHEFIRSHVSQLEGVDARFCQIVDAHFFRGRRSAPAAEAHQSLFADRVVDDIFMREGVVTHYLPLGPHGEKGIDVWLALEAFEMAIYKRFDILVLIVGDSDFIPLARKVNSLGTRVMVLGWDFAFTDANGEQQNTTTSLKLLEEVTYPVLMHAIIDDKTRASDAIMKNMFEDIPVKIEKPKKIVVGKTTGPNLPIPRNPSTPPKAPVNPVPVVPNMPPNMLDAQTGKIETLRDGYGFIKIPTRQSNLFFHWSDIENCDFNDLQIDDTVAFIFGQNDKGECAKKVIKVEP